MDKQTYYRDEKVVADYDDWRFGSAGGCYVDAVEKSTLIGMLGAPSDGKVLDMPCGTGRLLSALSQAGFKTIEGADSSPNMLKLAATRAPGCPIQEQNAFNTSYADGSFDRVCCLRFLFHVEDPAMLFREVARILKPGGLLVFDSLRWTPRNRIPLLNCKLGGKLYPYTEAQLTPLLSTHGFDMIAARRILLFPSQAYRYVPSWAVGLAQTIEDLLPSALRSKVVVLAKKRS